MVQIWNFASMDDKLDLSEITKNLYRNRSTKCLLHQSRLAKLEMSMYVKIDGCLYLAVPLPYISIYCVVSCLHKNGQLYIYIPNFHDSIRDFGTDLTFFFFPCELFCFFDF